MVLVTGLRWADGCRDKTQSLEREVLKIGNGVSELGWMVLEVRERADNLYVSRE